MVRVNGVLGLLALTVWCAAPVVAAEAGKSAVLREWKGLTGGMTTAGERVVRAPAEWAALWRQVTGNQVPPPSAPRVDFAKEMVIAVFMGERPTGGYSITIENVVFREKEIQVTVREQSPPPDAIVTQALTQPFHMIVVQKSARPVKFVRLPRRKGAVHRFPVARKL